MSTALAVVTTALSTAESAVTSAVDGVYSLVTGGVQTAIEELCNQTISKSSLHESCRREHRKGVTCGWSIARLERDAAIVHWNSRKALFAKRVVAAWRGSAWHFK